MEGAQDHIRLRVLEQSDGLAARGREADDDEAFALEQGPDAQLHDRMVLDREYAQDRAALALDLGTPEKGKRVGDMVGDLGVIGLIGGIVAGETDGRPAGRTGASDGVARRKGGRAA